MDSRTNSNKLFFFGDFRRPISAGCQHFAAAGFYSGPRRTQRASGWLAGLDTNFVTRCHNEWFFTRAMYRRVLGTGLFLFFGICCLSALKLTGASLGLWEICIIWGLGISGSVPDGRHFGGTSEPCSTRRPVAVCLLPGQKSWCPISWLRSPARLAAPCWPGYLQHPVYAI